MYNAGLPAVVVNAVCCILAAIAAVKRVSGPPQLPPGLFCCCLSSSHTHTLKISEQVGYVSIDPQKTPRRIYFDVGWFVQLGVYMYMIDVFCDFRFKEMSNVHSRNGFRQPRCWLPLHQTSRYRCKVA